MSTMAMNKDQFEDSYWNRIEFLALVFERQLEAITAIERMNVMNNLSTHFDVDMEDLYKFIEFGERPGEFVVVTKKP